MYNCAERDVPIDIIVNASKIFFININLGVKNNLLGRTYNVKIGKNRTYFKFNHMLIGVKIHLIVK
tara:strand:- start:524 stop:721 length:198 start_codon:yes stop_codon:yes gene_type:complete